MRICKFRITAASVLLGILIAGLSGSAAAATKVWTGNGGGPNWTDGANWSGGNAPAAGDALTFPNGPTLKVCVNDYVAGTSFLRLTLSGDGYTISGNAIALSDNVAVSATSSTGTNTIGLEINLGFSQTIDVSNANVKAILISPLTGTGVPIFNNNGAGTIELRGPASYGSGQVSLYGGRLRLAHPNAIPSYCSLNMLGSSLDVDQSLTIAGLGGSGTCTLGNGVDLTIHIPLTSTSLYLGTLAGAGGIIKSGIGTQIINEDSTYSGPTTVNGGKLEISGHTADTAITVNSGGTLAGTGTVGSVTCNAGATLEPKGTTGLACNDVALESGSNLKISINGTAGTNTKLVTTHAVTINNATLTAIAISPSNPAVEYALLVNSNGILGQFAGLTREQFHILLSGEDFDGNYQGGDGNDLTLTRVDPAATPFIAGIDPTSGPPGTIVDITGTGLSGTTGVTLAGTPAEFTVFSDTLISVKVPSILASGTFEVTTPGGTAESEQFDVTILTFVKLLPFTNGAPYYENGGVIKATTEISATIDEAPTGNVEYYIDGNLVTLTNAQQEQVTSIPLAPSGDGTAHPTIDRIPVPPALPPGKHELVISYRGDALFAPATETLEFWVGDEFDLDGDGTLNVSDQDLDGDGVANAVDPDVDGDLSLNAVDSDADNDGYSKDEETAAGTSDLDPTQRPQPPTITSFDPAKGPPGTVVDIAGTHFTGASSVTVNGMAAEFIVYSDTLISVTIPFGATSGEIRVNAPGGTVGKGPFNVTRGLYLIPSVLNAAGNAVNRVFKLGDPIVLHCLLLAGGLAPPGAMILAVDGTELSAVPVTERPTSSLMITTLPQGLPLGIHKITMTYPGNDEFAPAKTDVYVLVGTAGDVDGDGLPDANDHDSDNDGISDEIESQAGTLRYDPESFPESIADFDMDGIIDSADTDDDNDGVSDFLENSQGTDPYDPTANSNPTGDIDFDDVPNSADRDDDSDGVTDEEETFLGGSSTDVQKTGLPSDQQPLPAEPLSVLKSGFKIAFSGSGSDTLSISGTIPAPTPGFSPTFCHIIVNFGGFIRQFTLDGKGKFKGGGATAAFSTKASKGNLKYNYKLSKVDISEKLADEGLTAANPKISKQPRNVEVRVFLDLHLYSATKKFDYTASSTVGAGVLSKVK